MGSFREIVGSRTLRWLEENRHKLAHELTDHGRGSLTAAAALLAADLDTLERLTAPASDEAIIKTLTSMSEMFQVAVPEEQGLELYVAALRTLPRPAFVRARERLIVTHKWPRLPYPADFLEAGKETNDQLTTLIHVLTRAHNSCLRALEMLH